jgi:hypothetical protein
MSIFQRTARQDLFMFPTIALVSLSLSVGRRLSTAVCISSFARKDTCQPTPVFQQQFSNPGRMGVFRP